MYRLLLCTLLFTLLPVTIARATLYDFSPKPRAGANFISAAFRCWIPDTNQPLAGVLVVIPGQNADGRDFAQDSDLQSRCKTWNFALIGCYFTGDATRFYSDAGRGSGRALKDAMLNFSDQSGKRELATTSMALMGFSAGGQFAYGMTCYKSKDVLAFVCDKGAFFTSRPNGGALDTPGLFIVGEEDKTKSPVNTLKVFTNGRTRRGIWAMHQELKQAHKPAEKEVRELALDFIQESILLRTDKDRPLNNPDKVKYDAGVFLHRTTGEIKPRPDRTVEDSADWSWIPTQKLAEDILSSRDLFPEKK